MDDRSPRSPGSLPPATLFPPLAGLTLARYATITLAILGGLELLLSRMISRVGAAPPLEGTPRAIVEALSRVGYFLVSPAFVVAAFVVLLALARLGAEAIRGRRYGTLALAVYLSIFSVVAVVHIVVESPGSQGWLNATLNILSAVAVWWICLKFGFSVKEPKAARFALVLVALAYSGSSMYVLGQLFAGNSSGGGGVLARDIGELFAVAAPFAFFAAIAIPNGEWRHPRRWILPIVLALLFAAGNIADAALNQGFTGIFTNWSLGFALVWPSPLYVLSLALFVYSILTCFSTGSSKSEYANTNTGYGLLFLLMAGYFLQLPYQHLLAVLSLMMLTGLFRPFAIEEDRKQKTEPLSPSPSPTRGEGSLLNSEF